MSVKASLLSLIVRCDNIVFINESIVKNKEKLVLRGACCMVLCVNLFLQLAMQFYSIHAHIKHSSLIN